MMQVVGPDGSTFHLTRREWLAMSMQKAYKREREKFVKNSSKKTKDSLALCAELRLRVSSWTKMEQSFESAKKETIDAVLFTFYGKKMFLNWKFKV